MYAIFIYIWVVFSVNGGKYAIHGAYGMTWKMIVMVNRLPLHKILIDYLPILTGFLPTLKV